MFFAKARNSEKEFITAAATITWFPTEMTKVRTTPSSPAYFHGICLAFFMDRDVSNYSYPQENQI
jgi:hypothetical protein